MIIGSKVAPHVTYDPMIMELMARNPPAVNNFPQESTSLLLPLLPASSMIRLLTGNLGADLRAGYSHGA